MRFLLKRMGAMLCIVLALAFAGASAASAVNGIQHRPGSSAHHEHMPFSDMLVDADDHHDDHGNAGDRDGSPAADHQPGTGHHHHGDSGSGLPAFTSTEMPMPGLEAGQHDLTRDPAPPGLSSYGPERPPKRRTTSV